MTLKQRARVDVSLAIRGGTLTREPCETCGEAKSEAHHDDYTKPLDVRWLCRRHHRWHHSYADAVASGMGGQVRKARVAAGLTQPEFAERVGVKVRVVSHWEAGTRKPWRYLAEIARATGKPLTFFVEDTA